MAAVEREKERAAPERKATLDLGPKAAAVEEETANKAVVNMVEVFIRMILRIMLLFNGNGYDAERQLVSQFS
jgi:hypothetical protein